MVNGNKCGLFVLWCKWREPERTKAKAWLGWWSWWVRLVCFHLSLTISNASQHSQSSSLYLCTPHFSAQPPSHDRNNTKGVVSSASTILRFPIYKFPLLSLFPSLIHSLLSVKNCFLP